MQNPRLPSLIFIAALAVTSVSRATVSQQTGLQSTGSYEELTSEQRLSEKPVTFNVGVLTETFEYREEKMKDTATLSGISAAAEFSLGYNSYAGADFDFVNGGGTYDGQTQGGTPLTSPTRNDILNLRGTFSGKVWQGEGTYYSPYVGLGYRSLTNTQEGPGSYKREVNYLYVPLGVRLETKTPTGWILGVGGEYDLFLAGHVKTHLSDADSRLPDIDNTQTNGYGLRLSANVAHDFRAVRVALRPFLQIWSVEDSDRVYIGDGLALYEPKNSTSILGANLSVLF